ncbi:hypothetical protein L6452_22917 [Arctium lappa]|uniref:Uncharacterized protein n=1 Tax=Arctium lappa TaxID=4217 RepID=A0ACB9B097_ARCLA|nr:hypothetical protein L6452_22917 [Arctium lappa]
MGYSHNMSLVCAILIAYLHFFYAQNAPQDYVNTHNQARKEVGVGPVKWDAKLAKFAENYANQRKTNCALHNSPHSSKYGENLATGSGEFTGMDAVKLWISKKGNYDYKSNSCIQNRSCGSYIQVVWRKSTLIGCARVKCNTNGWFVICSYDPPGNIEGEKPY